jgi:hypothetical protein
MHGFPPDGIWGSNLQRAGGLRTHKTGMRARTMTCSKRVDPGTYRLRCFSDKPKIIKLVRIKLKDCKMQYLWRWFSELAQKKNPEKWTVTKKSVEFGKQRVGLCFSTLLASPISGRQLHLAF